MTKILLMFPLMILGFFMVSIYAYIALVKSNDDWLILLFWDIKKNHY